MNLYLFCLSSPSGYVPSTQALSFLRLSSARLCLWLALSLSASLYADTTVAIVNPGEATHPFERKTLRAAFGMTLQSWPDGQPLTIFVFRDENPLHQQFCRTVLGVLPYSLRRNWDRLLFSGGGQAPIVVNNVHEMLQRVATTPGAIGYLNKESVDESVSIIEIAQ
jgi:hypothetical protein